MTECSAACARRSARRAPIRTRCARHRRISTHTRAGRRRHSARIAYRASSSALATWKARSRASPIAATFGRGRRLRRRAQARAGARRGRNAPRRVLARIHRPRLGARRTFDRSAPDRGRRPARHHRCVLRDRRDRDPRRYGRCRRAERHDAVAETHVAIVPADRIVDTMEDAFALIREERGRVPRAINLISGPSRTGDIEQTIVLGAHGPFRVHILVVDASATSASRSSA